MRFPFEFLHLNEAARIRGRNGNDGGTHVHASVDTHSARRCFEFVGANCRSSHPFVPPLLFSTPASRSFSSTFQPRRPPRSLIYLFPRVSRSRLGSFFLFIAASLFPFFAHFVRFPPFPFPSFPFRSLPFRRRLTTTSSRLDFDVAQEPPISGNWLQRAASAGVQYSKV